MWRALVPMVWAWGPTAVDLASTPAGRERSLGRQVVYDVCIE